MILELTEELVTLGGRSAPLAIRRPPRARRMTLRVRAATGEVVLSLPRRTSVARGLAFVREHAAWLARQLHALPDEIPFADGAAIPLLGVAHTLRHRPESRGGVTRRDGELWIGGDPAFLPRRLKDWLKKEARAECAARARAKAETLGAKPRAVAAREMRSRWGSCSEDGRLAFCWRLILAPEEVLDYVVAHEVAHLVEMNHSKRFWEITASLCADARASRAWLKKHGAMLHRYGG